MKSVIIVGSGLSGLAAAYRLKKNGWQVKVLESTNRLCGRVSTFEKNGYLIDGGPTAVSKNYQNYIQLMRELNIVDQLVPSSNVVGLVRHGKLHTIDTSRPISGFLKTKVLSWPEKLRLMIGGLKLLKATKGIQLTDVLGHTKYDTESISAFLAHHFDQSLIDLVFDPIARVVTLGDKNDTSCLELFAGLVAANSELVNVKGGLETLPRALAKEVQVQLGSCVKEVKRSDGKITIRYEQDGIRGDLKTEAADACIITSTFFQAVDMCPQLAVPGKALAKHTRSAPCYVVHLGYAALTHVNPYVVTIPSTESPHISAIFLEHNKAPDRAPKGHSLVMVYYCPSAIPVISKWTPDQMLADSQQRIEALFPELQGKLDMHNIQYVDRASHYGPVGYYADVKSFLDRHPASDPVQIAGDYLSIPGQETAVSWGLRAADNLISSSRTRPS